MGVDVLQARVGDTTRRPDMFGRIGMEELLVILALAVLVFGPRRLPEFGKAIGQTIKEFRNVGRELHGDDEAPRV